MKKILLLIAVSMLGCVFVAATLLSAKRIDEPVNFRSDWQTVAHADSTIKQVNAEYRQRWDKYDLQVAARADDLLIARRLSLALIGTVPSLEEIRLLESKPDDERINWWLTYLFEDDRFPYYTAERLARAYVGVENGPFILYRRRRFVFWLADQLKANRPYDQMAREIFTSTGLWTDSPAVNFFTVTIDVNDTEQPDPVRLAARTTRAFLGMRIDCMQCHDDMLGDLDLGDPDTPRGGTQQDFHQLASFFAEAKVTGTGLRDIHLDQYRYQYLGEDEEELVPIAVPYAADLVPETGSRREKLATWMTNNRNRPFARAMVNRVWAMMFGRPMTEVVDSIPLHIDADGGNLPAGMETLTTDFIENGYDLQRLIRIIATTEPFQRDWRTDFEVTKRHEDRFAVFPLTRLRPEQVSRSIIQAVSLSTINEESHVIQKLTQFGQTNDFIKQFGDRGEQEFQEESGTIPQRLVMMNGQLVSSNSSASPFALNAVTQSAVLAGDDEHALETAYLCILTRRPSDRERDHFGARLQGLTGDERVQAMEDIFWIYFNSTEFGWNH